MKTNTHTWINGVAVFAVAAIGGGSILLAQNDGDSAATPGNKPPAAETDTPKPKEKRKAKVRVVTPEEAEESSSGYLGVATRPIDRELPPKLGTLNGSGLVVDYIEDGSPASKAGLQVDDVLVKVDDQILFNAEQLRGLIGARKPGDEVALGVIRGDKAQEIKAKLIARDKASAVKRAPWVLPNPDPFMQQPAVPPRGLLPRGGAFHFQFPAPGQGGANAQSKAMISDDSGKYEITNNNGKKHLKATDPDGKVVFDGPINTEEERKKVPAGILNKVEMMKVEVHPMDMQLDVEDMLRGLLGGKAQLRRGQAQIDRMLKLIEEMGGDVPGGFDEEKFRKLLEPFGVDIPDMDLGGGAKPQGKPKPRTELVDPKNIN